jgi:4-carboxymuconolactone decarboxylase
MTEDARYRQGLAMRRAVLGDEYVDRSLKTRTAFNGEFQELVTQIAWGDVWCRPGLPRHDRSLITMAMLIALNREDEFRLHIRAAAGNGVSREEIKELLLQACVYCGVPAANGAFRAAGEVFAEIDAVVK